MKSDSPHGDPKKPVNKNKPPSAHDPDEIVDLGTLPDTEDSSGEISKSQISGPLIGTSVVTWDQLMRAKSEAEINLDFDSLDGVEVDSPSDRDLLKHLKLDDPNVPTLEHSRNQDDLAEIGKSMRAAKDDDGDFTESSIFAPSGQSKGPADSEVDLLGKPDKELSSFSKQPRTEEIAQAKLRVARSDDDVASELSAAIQRESGGSAVDLGSEAIVDLPYPLGGDSAAQFDASSRRRRARTKADDDSGSVDLLGSSGGLASIPGLTAVADSMRRGDVNLPSTRRVEVAGKSKGWLGGGIVGMLGGLAISTGVYLSGVLTPTEKPKQQPPNMTQPAIATVPADLAGALTLLDSGDVDKAVEQLGKLDKTSPETRTALGQARVLKYLRDCKLSNQQPSANAEELKTAQADLKGVDSAVASLWLGLIEESFGKTDAARTIYQEARTKYAKDGKVFQAALDRLDSQPTGPTAPKITMNSFGAPLFTLLIQVETTTPDEPGVSFWKAVRLAKKHEYSEALTVLQAARDAHEKRRFAVPGKRLNPTSDPLEESFLRCCDELRDYWAMRKELHTTLNLATQTSAPAALTQALNERKNGADEIKTMNTKVAAIKDALSQSGYDLNDLPAAVNKLVKAKENVEAAVKAAQTDKATAEARQQAASLQVTQAEAAKRLVEDELKKTRDQLAAMKPTTPGDTEVVKLREDRQKLEAKAKDLEEQLATVKLSAERSQSTARELMNFVTSVKQKIQASPEARPADVLNNLDQALAAKPVARQDLPPAPVAAGDPRAERAYARGLSTYRAGDVATAEREFAAAVAMNGMDARYWYFMGLCKAAQGQFAEGDFQQGFERERRNQPNAGVIDASLERLPPEARQTINRARGRSQ